MAKKSTLGEKKADSPVQLDDFIDLVKLKALEVYLQRQRTGKPGNEISDWVTAEKDIKAKYNIA